MSDKCYDNTVYEGGSYNQLSAPIMLPPFLRAKQPGLRFVPDQAMVLRCDLRDYRSAEIGGKVRPVIVVSPQHLNCQTVYVAPLSRAEQWVTPTDVHLPADRYPFFSVGREQWVKTRLIMPVDRTRLDRLRVGGRWCTPRIDTEDLQRVLVAINTIFALQSAA